MKKLLFILTLFITSNLFAQVNTGKKVVIKVPGGGSGTDSLSFHSITQSSDSTSAKFNRPNGTGTVLKVVYDTTGGGGGGSGGTSGLPISIRGSEFDFAVPSVAGTQTLLTSNSNMVKFDDCTFRYYGLGTNLVFSGAATFENCFFSGTVTGLSNPIFVKYANGVVDYNASQIIRRSDTIPQPSSVKLSLKRSYVP